MAPSAAPVAASPREAARFISVSQAYAGAFLNAVRASAAGVPDADVALRIALQRRLPRAAADGGYGGGGRRWRREAQPAQQALR